MKRALLILPATILLSCIHSRPLSIHTWSELKMPGLELNLNDPTNVEWYEFGSDGGVSATIGERGGPYSAPLYYWRTDGNLLLVTDWDQKVVEKLRLLEVGHGEIVVQKSSGAKVTYEMKRN